MLCAFFLLIVLLFILTFKQSIFARVRALQGRFITHDRHGEVLIDPLTNLPNRKKLIKALNRILNDEAQNNPSVALYILDIDRFRLINTSYGRHIGDELLKAIARRVHNDLHYDAMLARESGDEMYVLMTGVTDDDVRLLGKRLTQLFTKPFLLNGRSLYVRVSVGVSQYPKTARNIDELIHYAEMAMYEAKRSSKSHYYLFLFDDVEKMERQRVIELGLNARHIYEELYLRYQPIVRLSDGEIVGVEALLRWIHPELGDISPSEFIPIAESSGLIVDIGYWVLYESVKQVSLWHQSEIGVTVAINVSVMQLSDDHFVTRVVNVLDLYDVDAASIVIEITESVIQNVEYVGHVINQLRNIGVRVSIDDFGTGYSSLSSLNSLRVDSVKIDKSFVDMLSFDHTALLIETMIQMSNHLNVDVVAEGIETIEQLAFLKTRGCMYGQGYLFSKPVSPQEISVLVKLKKKGKKK